MNPTNAARSSTVNQVWFSMPRSGVYRSFVMTHLIHHRAQIGVYRLLLDAAVPGMYGPSAEEEGRVGGGRHGSGHRLRQSCVQGLSGPPTRARCSGVMVSSPCMVHTESGSRFSRSSHPTKNRSSAA